MDIVVDGADGRAKSNVADARCEPEHLVGAVIWARTDWERQSKSVVRFQAMIQVEPFRETREVWDSFVDRSPSATSSHQFRWKEVIEKAFGHRCMYLAAYCGDERSLVGVLPLVRVKSTLFGDSLVSMPFLNYGGILCDEEAVQAALISKAEELRRSIGSDHVELRHVNRRVPGIPERHHKVTMFLDLCETADAQWRSFDPKLRNQVRKAEKSGLRAVVGGIEALDGFYKVFARNMRDLGTPVYSKRFFESVLNEFRDSACIVSVMSADEVVASGIMMWYRGVSEMPWASSISESLRLCPNHMLYWTSIQLAIERGDRQFDFGRSTPGEGTFRFKKSWGARDVTLNWQYLLDEGKDIPNVNPSNPRYRLAIDLWRRLPVWLTRIMGPPIVKCIP